MAERTDLTLLEWLTLCGAVGYIIGCVVMVLIAWYWRVV